MPSSNFSGAIQQGLNFAAQRDQQKLARKQQLMQLDKQRKGALFQDARAVNSYLKSGQVGQALNTLSQRASMIEQLGGDISDTKEVADLIAKGDITGATNLLDSVELAGVGSGFLQDLTPKKESTSSESKFFNEMMEGLSENERQLAKRIKLGLSPRAVGSSSQTISKDLDLVNDVAQAERIISSAKETGKLASQFKLNPSIAKAVGIANARVKEITDNNKISKSNKKALGIYEVGIRALSEAMGEASTGPIVGLFPSLTSSAQASEGAIAMLGPTLKSVFRESGEGSFTEGDQKLLMDMLPTMKDRPEARDFKLKALDSMIRLKLGNEGDDLTEDQIMAKYGL